MHWGPKVDIHEELGSRQCMVHTGRRSFENGALVGRALSNRFCGLWVLGDPFYFVDVSFTARNVFRTSPSYKCLPVKMGRSSV